MDSTQSSPVMLLGHLADLASPRNVEVGIRLPTEVTVRISDASFMAMVDSCGVESLRRRGLRKVSLAAPVDLRGPGQDVAIALRLVRECTAQQVLVDWSVVADDQLDVTPLFGLTPPIVVAGIDSAAKLWRERFRFGSLYWRAGPGFILISDTRGAIRNEYKLKASGLVQTFLALASGAIPEEADLYHCHALRGEGLVFESDGWTIGLPYRMRSWPIPCNAA